MRRGNACRRGSIKAVSAVTAWVGSQLHRLLGKGGARAGLRRLPHTACLATCMSVPVASARRAAHAALARGDHRFVQTAIQGGQAEDEVARMAQSRATNVDVKAFVQRMEQDHGKANES